MKNIFTFLLTFFLFIKSFDSVAQYNVEAFVGEIRIFSGNFAPKGWAFCDGQALSIAFYQPLFSIIGCTYGGNNQTYFNLPNLNNRVVIGSDRYNLGQVEGSDKVDLKIVNIENNLSQSTEQEDIISVATSQSLDTHQPSLRLTYIICLEGIYPTRP
jgi:microcystin-dependent protein